MFTRCPKCGKTYTHLYVGECCSACGFTVKVVAEDVQLESARRDPRGISDGCGTN